MKEDKTSANVPTQVIVKRAKPAPTPSALDVYISLIDELAVVFSTHRDDYSARDVIEDAKQAAIDLKREKQISTLAAQQIRGSARLSTEHSCMLHLLRDVLRSENLSAPNRVRIGQLLEAVKNPKSDRRAQNHGVNARKKRATDD